MCIYIYTYVYRYWVTFTEGIFHGCSPPRSCRRSRILSIVFNPNGTRCVTTDNNGVVGVWKTDQRGLCNQIFGSETFVDLYLQGMYIYMLGNILYQS